MMGTVSVKSESTVNRRLSQGICKGKSINIDQNAPKVTQPRTLLDPWDAPWGRRGGGRKNTEVNEGALSLILNTNGLIMHLFVVELFKKAIQ